MDNIMIDEFAQQRQIVLCEITATLECVDSWSVSRLIESILSARKVFFVGVGRVFLSLEAIAKRLAHLGIDTHCVGEITEPAITDKDLLIVGSGSGESLFPVAIAQKAHSIGAKVVHIGSNYKSSMAEYAAFMVRIPVRTKLGLSDEINSAQPMTSLFEQTLLILGDIVAKMIIEQKNLDVASLWQYHANLE